MGGDKTEKTIIMVFKVDLQCSCCYKKVKKILCKFPQIRDQVYEEKTNTVTITVVCCDPEKIRDKLCSKGCGVIKSIEIKEPPKLKSLEKPKESVNPKEAENPEKSTVVIIEMPKETEKPKKDPKTNPVAPPSQPPPELIIVQKYPQPPPGYCCGQCYEGHIGGPCYQLYGRPLPLAPCYDNCGPRPYGYRRGCYVSRYDEYYFTEENVTGCSIM